MVKTTPDPAVAKKVDAYMDKHEQWQSILQPIREILLATELTEAVKWGAPAYLLDGKILITLAGFKQHCAIWFHQGALLKDKEQKLESAQEGKTKGMRHWRFSAGDKPNKRLLKSYVLESIANQLAGKAVAPAVKKLVIPEELAKAMKQDKSLAAAFKALTPGRQRDYADHVAGAKQEKTRLARLQKITPMILSGVGLHDKYRNC